MGLAGRKYRSWRIVPATIADMRSMRPNSNANWAGGRKKPLKPGLRRRLAGIFAMKSGGGTSSTAVIRRAASAWPQADQATSDHPGFSCRHDGEPGRLRLLGVDVVVPHLQHR